MNGLVLMPTVAENRTSFFADAEVVEPIAETVEVPNHP